jgi:hypothetical protein
MTRDNRVGLRFRGHSSQRLISHASGNGLDVSIFRCRRHIDGCNHHRPSVSITELPDEVGVHVAIGSKLVVNMANDEFRCP